MSFLVVVEYLLVDRLPLQPLRHLHYRLNFVHLKTKINYYFLELASFSFKNYFFAGNLFTYTLPSPQSSELSNHSVKGYLDSSGPYLNKLTGLIHLLVCRGAQLCHQLSRGKLNG